MRWLAAAAAAPVEVRAGRVEMGRAGLAPTGVVLRLVVANRGPAAVTLHELVCQATLDGAPFRGGRLSGPVRVPARSQVEVALAAETARRLPCRDEATCRVVGAVRIERPQSIETLVFDESGTIAVSMGSGLCAFPASESGAEVVKT